MWCSSIKKRNYSQSRGLSLSLYGGEKQKGTDCFLIPSATNRKNVRTQKFGRRGREKCILSASAGTSALQPLVIIFYEPSTIYTSGTELILFSFFLLYNTIGNIAKGTHTHTEIQLISIRFSWRLLFHLGYRQ